MIQIDVLKFLIQKGPGRTASELAEAIHADKAYQQRVNEDCVMLVNAGSVKREGGGGVNDPFKYYPV
ncbi:MAG TPA: hypothetical protein VFK79_13375 [Xanthobacteraceae bacterium]|nr:hypothetical protein [Xanthobacteraceae bacterium]